MSRNQLLEDAIARDVPSDAHVLIGILPWGLGHATRCVPIIEALQKKQFLITIFTGRESYVLLKERFPTTKIVNAYLPPVCLKGNSITLHLLRNLPILLIYWIKSQIFIRKEMKYSGKQVLISDNFPGFYSSKARLNIYITHQIRIINRNLRVSGLFSWLHQQIWKKYDLCWIPDDPKIRLAGKMSAPPSIKYRYIGLLSRFNLQKIDNPESKQILILLSGPEPHRTNLETQLIKSMGKLYPKDVTVVRGIAENAGNGMTFPDHWKVFDLLQEIQLEKEIRNAGTIITRCGYTTLMELYQTDARIIFIPTPGQSEQNYLASTIAKNDNSFLILQAKIESDLMNLL